MRNRSGIIALIFAGTLVSASVPHVFAGDVKLVSDTFDSLCGVEVTWGPSAPNDTPVELHSDIAKNWSIVKPEKLCYRRATTPDNCESGMTQWKTPWKCAESKGEVSTELSLQ